MVCFVILRSGDIVTVHHFSPNVQDCAGGLLWEGGGQQAGQSDHPQQEPHQVHPGTVGLIDGLLSRRLALSPVWSFWSDACRTRRLAAVVSTGTKPLQVSARELCFEYLV